MLMELVERAVGHLDPSPDLRLVSQERDLELIDLTRGRFTGRLPRCTGLLGRRGRTTAPGGRRIRFLEPAPLRLDPELRPDLIVERVADLPGMPCLRPPLVHFRVFEVRILGEQL